MVKGFILRVKVDRDIPLFFDQADSGYMIDVGVGVHDCRELDVVFPNFGEQERSFVTRVNVDSLPSLLAG